MVRACSAVKHINRNGGFRKMNICEAFAQAGQTVPGDDIVRNGVLYGRDSAVDYRIHDVSQLLLGESFSQAVNGHYASGMYWVSR